MGKRSTFERRERDFYPTPAEAVGPLLRHLEPETPFIEPCAGNGALAEHLGRAGHRCVCAIDIEPQRYDVNRGDALEIDFFASGPREHGEVFITNPPWGRRTLHSLIVHLSDQAPTWLLFDADWVHTHQAAPFRSRLRRIVSVGRIKWIPGSPFTGKDNCAWHLFDKPSDDACAFYMREAA